MINFLSYNQTKEKIKDENKISTYVYNEDKESKTNTTGVLQQTIYACQQSKGGKVRVTATASWLKEATYKGIDVFGVLLQMFK